MIGKSRHVGVNAPRNVVFQEAINALNSVGIRIERTDGNSGIIQAKKKDFWQGDQDVKVSITNRPNIVPQYSEGSSVYVEAYHPHQFLAKTTVATYIAGFDKYELTCNQFMQALLGLLARQGYQKVVELGPSPPSAGQTAYVSPSQAPPSYQQPYPSQQVAYPPPPPPPPPQAAQTCPTCRGPLTFIQQYNRWYCYNCKKYP